MVKQLKAELEDHHFKTIILYYIIIYYSMLYYIAVEAFHCFPFNML